MDNHNPLLDPLHLTWPTQISDMTLELFSGLAKSFDEETIGTTVRLIITGNDDRSNVSFPPNSAEFSQTLRTVEKRLRETREYRNAAKVRRLPAPRQGAWADKLPPVHLRTRAVLLRDIGWQKFQELGRNRIGPVGSRWHVYAGMVAPEGWTEADAEAWRAQHGFEIGDHAHVMPEVAA